MEIPYTGLAGALKSTFKCSPSVCSAWDVQWAPCLWDRPLSDPHLTASSAERPGWKWCMCITLWSTAPRGHLCPRHSGPLGRLTLFQQPWTGKPSSPCSEEGSTRLRLSGRPIEQAAQGQQDHTLWRLVRTRPRPALVYFFSIPTSSRSGP